MKYRLNIKYPISEKDIDKLRKNSINLNTLFSANKCEITSNDVTFDCYPESWIEEIKPVVLSANEYLQSLLSIDRDVILTIEDDAEYHVKKAFKAGYKNGQLRDRQKTQPLIDAVDVFLKRMNVDCEDQTELSLNRVKLLLILKDIKPLDE